MANRFGILLGFGRLLLLICSILGLVAWGIFSFRPKLVREADQAFVQRYEKQAQERLQNALKSLRNKKDENAARDLEALLVDLESVQKLDRLAGLKRSGLLELTKHLSKGNKIDEALYWYDQWIAYDERDVLAQMERIRLLLRIPERRAEGEKLLSDLFQKLPEVWFISKLYVDTLIRKGMGVEALLAYHRSMIAAPRAHSRDWEVYWDSGKGFSEAEKTRVRPYWKEGSLLELSFRVPKMTRRVRLDLPAWLPVVLSEPVMVVDSGEEVVEVAIAKERLRTRQIRQVNEMLVARGAIDSYFFWNIPGGSTRARPARITLRAEVKRPSFSLVFREDVFHRTVVDEAIGRLIENGRLADAAIVFDDWSRGAVEPGSGGAWNVYWDQGSRFNEKHKKTFKSPQVEGGLLELAFELPKGVKRIRFDPPSGLTSGLAKPTLILGRGANARSFELWQEELAFKNMKRVEDRLMATAATDPYFIWKVSGGSLPGASTKLRLRARISGGDYSIDILQPLESPTLASAVVNELRARGEESAVRSLKAAWLERYGSVTKPPWTQELL